MKFFSAGIVLLVLYTLCPYKSCSQLSISGQLRTRTEFRDGQGNPLPKGASAAFFTSQRTRLSAGYNMYRLKFGIAVQDVRVWGQDVSTINRTTAQDNNGLMLHEAWAEIGITDTSNKRYSLALKIGRQELLYDDQRLLGNLDWLQQARRHDAAVLKLTAAGWNVHAGFAYSQNKENATGTVFAATPPGAYAGNTNAGVMYKSFEYLHASHTHAKGAVSFLLFADQFNKYHSSVENNAPVKVWDKGTWNRLTTGLYGTHQINALSLVTAAYYQAGKTAAGQKLSAALFSAQGLFNLSSRWAVGAGVDYTTGGTSGNTSHAFDPLYGTPHKFWGFMDYFYAGSAFGGKGLADYYLKATYKPASQWLVSLYAHRFASASVVFDGLGNRLSKTFGTEIDLVANYTLTKYISFEAGYSQFFNTSSLGAASVKNVPDARPFNQWAYLMIKVQPTWVINKGR